MDKLLRHLGMPDRLDYVHSDSRLNGPQATGPMWAMDWRAGHVTNVLFNTYAYPKKMVRKHERDGLRKNDYEILFMDSDFAHHTHGRSCGMTNMLSSVGHSNSPILIP